MHSNENRATRTGSFIMTCHSDEWGMSHIWMSQITHINESCYTYELSISHMRVSHVTLMDAVRWNSSGTDRQLYHDTSHRWMRHVTHLNSSVSHTNDPRHTYERVVSYVWMGHVTRVNGFRWKSSDTDRQLYHDITNRIQDALLALEARAKSGTLTHVYVWHDSFFDITNHTQD